MQKSSRAFGRIYSLVLALQLINSDRQRYVKKIRVELGPLPDRGITFQFRSRFRDFSTLTLICISYFSCTSKLLGGRNLIRHLLFTIAFPQLLALFNHGLRVIEGQHAHRYTPLKIPFSIPCRSVCPSLSIASWTRKPSNGRFPNKH